MMKLQEKVDKQAENNTSQLSFLESLDRKEKETRLVILGVIDEAESLEGETSDH